jgi:hypothetical protein
MAKVKKPNSIGGPFAWRTIEMLKSPAMRIISLSARRALDRIEIELATHGGKDNGELPVTKSNFEDYGIQHNAIAPALRELEAVGFIKVTTRGRAGNGAYHHPNLFRLTYRPTGTAAPTDDWRAITSIDDAVAAVRASRKSPGPPKKPRYRKPAPGKRSPAAETAIPAVPKTGSGNKHFPVPETGTAPVPETGTGTSTGNRYTGTQITGTGNRYTYLDNLSSRPGQAGSGDGQGSSQQAPEPADDEVVLPGCWNGKNFGTSGAAKGSPPAAAGARVIVFPASLGSCRQ